MIWLALALAADPTDAGTAVRSHTAETLPAGEAVVRWPAGRSAVGLGDTTDAWLTPFDLTIGGPRVGVERGGRLGATRWSVAPSVGAKTTLKRASLRLETNGSWDVGVHQLSGQLAVDVRFLRQLVVDEELSRDLSFDRVQAHVLGIWDTPHSRVKLRLPLADQGHGLTWGTVSAAWTHTTRRVHVAAGLGMLVGRPFDRYTLGHYAWWFWVPYPEVDLAVRF